MSLIELLRCKSGVAMTEFALGVPFLMVAGLGGSELANYALVNMKVSQLAEHLADNASRIGDVSTLQNRRIYESDINDILFGAQLQTGGAMNLFEHGRVFISSVQVDENANQYIHWQRCRGAKRVPSGYGSEGDRLSADGIGPKGQEVPAQSDDAVIFVEVNYSYQPLFSEKLVRSSEITATAAFTVRDDRDLSQIYQRDANSPDPVQSCSDYKGNMVVTADGSVS